MLSFHRQIQRAHQLATVFSALAVSCATLLMAGSASAARFETSLDELIGPVGFPFGDAVFVDFDFEQTFASVEGLQLQITASVTAEEFDLCETPDRQSCQHKTQLLGFIGNINTEDRPLNRFVFTRGLSVGDFTDLQGTGTDVEDFISTVGFDFLLDGEGTLQLGWNQRAVPDGFLFDHIDPTGTIQDARLIIDAVPIPEPSTGLLIGFGFFLLGGGTIAQRRHSRWR